HSELVDRLEGRRRRVRCMVCGVWLSSELGATRQRKTARQMSLGRFRSHLFTVVLFWVICTWRSTPKRGRYSRIERLWNAKAGIDDVSSPRPDHVRPQLE